MAMIKAVPDRCEASTQGLALCLTVRLELGPLEILIVPLRPEPTLARLPLDDPRLAAIWLNGADSSN